MTAKRALQMTGTPVRKRTKYSAPMVMYRGIKPEMKHKLLTISHTAATGANLAIPDISQGTSVEQRVGAKVKVWFIEGVIRGDVDSFRFDLLGINDSTTAPSHGYDTLCNRNEFSQLRVQYLNPGTYADSDGYYWQYRFPKGHVCKFSSSTGTTCNKGELVLRTLSPTASTITGSVRVWYTDV